MSLVLMCRSRFFYCPQKGASVLSCDYLSPVDQTFLRKKQPDPGETAACVCVFFLHDPVHFSCRSSATWSVFSGTSASLAEFFGAAFFTAQSVSSVLLAPPTEFEVPCFWPHSLLLPCAAHSSAAPISGKPSSAQGEGKRTQPWG